MRILVLSLTAITLASTAAAADLTVQGRANANPSIAAQGRFVAITWGAATQGGMTDIYAALSRDGGRAFSAPARVNDVAGDASLSGEQPPHVALVPHAGSEPSIVVVWTAKAPSGTRILSARSDDGGKTFGRATEVPGSSAPGNRGWETTAVDRDGKVLAMWLDHREMAAGAPKAGGAPQAPMPQGEHQHAGHDTGKPDGAVQAEMSKLFFARIGDTQPARALLGGVCYCCKTTMATGSDGSVYAAWRHVYPGNIRDIAFTMSRDAGRTFAPPIRVSEDRWVLDGCPENGPALALDAQRRIHIVWPTLVPADKPGAEPTLALFYAMSRDGRSFTPRQRIETQGLPRHVQIATLAGNQIVLMWDEQRNGNRVVVGRGTVSANGAARFARQPLVESAPGVYPVIAASDDAVVAAWTSGQTGSTVIRIERLAN